MVVADTGHGELNESVDVLTDHGRELFHRKLHLITVERDPEKSVGAVNVIFSEYFTLHWRKIEQRIFLPIRECDQDMG